MDNFFLKFFMFLVISCMAGLFINSLVELNINGAIIFGISLLTLLMSLCFYYAFGETYKYSKNNEGNVKQCTEKHPNRKSG